MAMELEVELKVTLKTKGGHFISPRSMLHLTHEDVLDYAGCTQDRFQQQRRKFTERALKTAAVVVHNAVLDQLDDGLNITDG
jgi:hypothetical protein